MTDSKKMNKLILFIYTVVFVKEVMFMGIENSNQGPGWHDHDTPYGTIHSYDGDTGTYGGGGTGGMLVVGIPVLLQIHG